MKRTDRTDHDKAAKRAAKAMATAQSPDEARAAMRELLRDIVAASMIEDEGEWPPTRH